MQREKSVSVHVRALCALILFLLLSSCTPGKQESPSPSLLTQEIHNKDYVAVERTLRQLEVEDHEYLIKFIREGDTLIGEHINTELTAIEVNTHQTYALLLIKANDWRRYLIFKLDGEKWKFFGEVAQVNYLRDPAHRVVTDSRGEAWLVIRYVKGHGTGVFSYGETWYSLNGKKMTEALVYAVENSVAGPPPEYPATVEVKGDVYYYDGILDRSFNVKVSSEAAYSDRQGHPLFHIQRTVYYVWSPTANRFLLDMEKPDHIQQEAERVFPYSKDEFLLYAYDELLELARDGNQTQREWLEQILSTMEDSPEKENLSEILNSQ